MSDALIIDACRTPRGIGKPGKGALAHLHPQRLASSVLAAIAERNDLDTSKVDDIIWGTSNQSGTQAGDLGRMGALDAGYDVKASGVTLDRFCGSGITSSNLAAGMIGSGLEDIVIAGGTDMMSTYAANRVPGLPPFMDAGNTHLRSIHPQPHQGICGDAIATLEGIPRDALDDLAFESQQRAAKAIAEGRFERSLITVHNDDGTVALDHDEYPRPQTTREGLSGLAPAFAGLYDGTGAAILTTEANELCAPVHDRMPVVLPDREAEAAWLSEDVGAEEALELLVPLASARVSVAPANPAVNKAGVEGAELLTPPSDTLF